MLRNEWGPRPLPSGFHTRNDPTPDCERVAEKPSRRALKAAAGEFDSFLGVGPGTLADTPKHVVTSEGYVIKGDAGVGASMLKGASTDDAMDAVAGNFGVAKPEFKDRKWLQDDAIVAAILQNDKETSKRERAAKRAAKRRMMRVGAPRPPGPPRGEVRGTEGASGYEMCEYTDCGAIVILLCHSGDDIREYVCGKGLGHAQGCGWACRVTRQCARGTRPARLHVCVWHVHANQRLHCCTPPLHRC